MTDEIAPPTLEEKVIDVLKTVYDPEIPVNIYDLGLVYAVEVSPEGDVHVDMTLTAPNCPVADTIPNDVAQRLQVLEGVRDVKVELVWDPPWTKERMSEAARLETGFF